MRVLLVDLNNFGRYPTIPIGYLTAILRNDGTQVDVLSPLSIGVDGVAREVRPHGFSLLAAQCNYRAATSTRAWVRRLRGQLAARRRSGITRQKKVILRAFGETLSRAKPDLVMISTYLMYRDVCIAICAASRSAGIPVVVGGPYFAQPEVVKAWVRIEGLTALTAGEIELRVPSIVKSVLRAEDLSRHPGVFTAGRDGEPVGSFAQPLKTLDEVPFPDFSDFPWRSYPNRIAPIITGRGCAWGACSFCSDVTSSAGRTFRSRSPQNVLSEISHHRASYGVRHYVFTDLKLNSDVRTWRSVIDGIQAASSGARWIGAVHVGPEPDNGLSRSDLHSASASGCVRLTTGLESGSQQVLDQMRKGTQVEAVSAFLHEATSAGISCRCTMVIGHPGEMPEDVEASAEFVERHRGVIERVSLNRLQVTTGTALHRDLQRHPERFPSMRITAENHAVAELDHENPSIQAKPYRRAVMRLLASVHEINRQPLSPRAREFEGVM